MSSAALVLGTLAVLAGCGDGPTRPVTRRVPAPSQAMGNGNSPNAKLCQKNGWQGLVTSTGDSFASEEDCVAYAANGGTLYRAQTITFDALAGKTYGDADFDVSATASSGLTVTFTASGDCTVSGATVHLTGAGSCTITAHQAGDATWYAAPDVSQSFAIAKADQTIAFTSVSPAFGILGGPTYTPTATATSGLPVAITLDGASSGCSLTSGVVSFTATGTCIIDANQAGDANWNAAAQQQQSIAIFSCISNEAELRFAAAAGGSYDFSAADTRIVLTGGVVAVTSKLTLSGVGGGNAVVDANGASRVFTVDGPTNFWPGPCVASSYQLTLKDVTVTGGWFVNPFGVQTGGGGIFVDGCGSLILNGNSSVSGNRATAGGGVYIGQRPGGFLTMNDASTVSNNAVDPVNQSGFYPSLTNGGGVVLDGPFAIMTMNGASSVRGNTLHGGPYTFALGGGVMMNGATLTMNDNAEISNNVVDLSYEGRNYGGGISFYSFKPHLTLTGSAHVTQNVASHGGGIDRNDAGSGTITGVTAANVTGNQVNNCEGGVPGCVN